VEVSDAIGLSRFEEDGDGAGGGAEVVVRLRLVLDPAVDGLPALKVEAREVVAARDARVAGGMLYEAEVMVPTMLLIACTWANFHFRRHDGFN
jgi:hypothetical protein